MKADRQQQILDLLVRQDKTEIAALSEQLKVSPSTIRREIRFMEKQGLLERVYGTVRLPKIYQSSGRGNANNDPITAAKRAIAGAAREMIPPGAVIGIIGGTTCAELAWLLRVYPEPLTIVTCALNIAMYLLDQPNKRVMVTGGFISSNPYILVGNLVPQSLQSIHLDMVFTGVSGIDSNFGFTVYDEPDALVSQAFMSVADKTIVLSDHTKIGKATFSRLSGFGEVDLLITDSDASPEQIEPLRSAGLEVTLAKLIRESVT